MSATAGLKPVERDILRLLARGHDAKSAAAELGLSVNAVNERLRDARRRTGAGSSRELARHLAAEEEAQENRDDFVGLARAGAVPPSPSRNEGRTTMVIAGLIGAGVAGAVLLAGAAGETRAGPPRVTAISPASGATVPAGPLTVSVTFDRPMRADGWSFTTSDRGAYPPCAAAPRVSPDRRTFALACTARAGGRYAVGINGGGFRNFAGEDGTPALPAETVFRVR